MGPIRLRNPSKPATSLWWKTTAFIVLLTGCQAPRPVEAPPATEPVPAAPAAQAPADRVRSVAEADGATRLALPPRTDLQPGDALHIRDGDRLVATALVTASDEHQTLARVIALTDQRRPVHPGDAFGTVPRDEPVAAAPQPAQPEAKAPVEPPAPAVEAHAVPAAEPEHAPTVEHAPEAEHPAALIATVATPAAVAAEHAPAPEHAPAETPAPEPAAEHPAAATPTAAPEPAAHADEHPTPTEATADKHPAETLEPEVRARLEAERAYWELAARILRLPDGGPELTALQQRLRTEVAAQGTAP